jgi:exportin-2 (importin alpha re-exporter)
MGVTERKIHSQLIEAIALMSKRNVQSEWPGLLPELQQTLGSGDLRKIRVALECIKKICKKYRFMFRSDALYSEMNYMIENMSGILLQCLQAATEQLGKEHSVEQHSEFLLIANCVLHIFESILS